MFNCYSVIVSQDVASDSGIGDMVFAGTDSLGQLSNEVETNEKSQSSTAEEMSLTGTAEGMSLTGTAEGMPLTGTVEGMPLHDTAEGITPNGALDEKKLKLTVLGVYHVPNLPIKQYTTNRALWYHTHAHTATRYIIASLWHQVLKNATF